eukprot:CAMPEP_0203774950 /NCGR_PEP_ID=MMETSP0099_2-20121227/5710_1 /ASSEMBLY_ACC=CAM_ASM_000209 /TAXON_ID=96639 /ORGANISM=" , Strain NY0313808BC1" /LENGTH=222 /DNA_ID=CAMNT_0050673373 /DNA_START=524 /DNA_END=1192 /DNA_ORIENTATION=+
MEGLRMDVKQVQVEFMGCVVASCLSALAFFLPSALGLPYTFWCEAFLYFCSMLVYDRFHLKAALNPAVHFQDAVIHGQKVALRSAVLSIIDLLGFVVGNYIGLCLIALLDENVNFQPPPHSCGYFEAVFYEGLMFFLFQWFSFNVAKSVVVEAAFGTLLVFTFYGITGSYFNPSAYFSKVIISDGIQGNPVLSPYLIGPLIGAYIATLTLSKVVASSKNKSD